MFPFMMSATWSTWSLVTFTLLLLSIFVFFLDSSFFLLYPLLCKRTNNYIFWYVSHILYIRLTLQLILYCPDRDSCQHCCTGVYTDTVLVADDIQILLYRYQCFNEFSTRFSMYLLSLCFSGFYQVHGSFQTSHK